MPVLTKGRVEYKKPNQKGSQAVFWDWVFGVQLDALQKNVSANAEIRIDFIPSIHHEWPLYSTNNFPPYGYESGILITSMVWYCDLNIGVLDIYRVFSKIAFDKKYQIVQHKILLSPWTTKKYPMEGGLGRRSSKLKEHAWFFFIQLIVTISYIFVICRCS